ncbi:hypothetical protein BBP40_003579 [Aspergillus hancockii]|nr:hypothetical protein BBP40_003579 [Aspergillus hancockii]
MFGIPSKRQRGHEELADCDSISIHERKKHRSLALRTSLKGSQKLALGSDQIASGFGLSTLTPVESSDDDDGYNKHVRAKLTDRKGKLPHLATHSHAHMSMDIDYDKDMLSSNQCAWPVSACGNRDIQPSPIPHSLVNQSLNISEQHTVDSPCGYFPPTTRDQNPTQSTCYQTSDDSTASYFDLQRPQRLPSPASEDEDAMTSFKDNASDVDMTYNTSRPASFSPSTWVGMEDSSLNMQHHIPSTGIAKEKQQASASKTVASKKKVTISMGFRADCEKCRGKVPGHYSHIIRT